MKTSAQNNHATGSKCMVKTHISKEQKTVWVAGTITGRTSADDREYRVNVDLQDGRSISACAPECVVMVNADTNLDTKRFGDKPTFGIILLDGGGGYTVAQQIVARERALKSCNTKRAKEEHAPSQLKAWIDSHEEELVVLRYMASV